jgi:choline-glycine betaine transporter
MMGMMGWMSLWMVIGLIVFLAAVAGAVYVGIRLTQRDDEPDGQRKLG